jgi:hypothetical protein
MVSMASSATTLAAHRGRNGLGSIESTEVTPIRFSPVIGSGYQRIPARLIVGIFGVVIVTLSALSADLFHD